MLVSIVIWGCKMREQMLPGRPAIPESYSYGLSPEGRAAVALGMIALVLGFGAVAAAAYVGIFTTASVIQLPGGLPTLDPRVVALVMATLGTITTALGGLTLYKSQDM